MTTMREILNRYKDEDGDWDDIVSPDEYEEMLERKRFNQSQGYPAWTKSYWNY